MYLAKLQHGLQTTYQIRQSYRIDEDRFQFRIVYDLGEEPRRFVQLYDHHIVLFDDDLLAAISPHVEGDGELELEKLLLKFLPLETRRRSALLRQRTNVRVGPLNNRDRKAIAAQVHLFDRRRLYYLRYGAVDQSRLSRLHEKCCRPLLDQSRDEREYYFADEEMVLGPGNYLQYVYAIFNIQKYFHQSFAPWLPEALAREEMDLYFLKELCRLHDDVGFWQGESPGNSLHRHLVRYLIMFFDHSPTPPSFQRYFVRNFMADHRRFSWPMKLHIRNTEQISAVFQTPYQQLKTMDKKALTRLYRRKAMDLHPDHGGDHELFIELTEAYNQLLQSR